MTYPLKVNNIKADAVVIGAGLTGLSLAYHLNQLGVKNIVVLERGYPGCELYGRFSAGVRRQFGTRLEIELVLAGLPFFDFLLEQPEIRAGYEPVGYAFLAGPEHIVGLRQSWQLQQEMGVNSVWLEAGEIAEKFPYCDSAGMAAATFCGDDFWLNPWEVHQWLLRTVKAAGVCVFEQSPVTGIEISQGAIQAVNCLELTVKTAVVVNAAGARTRLIQQMAGSDAPVDPSPRVKYLIKAPSDLPRTMPLITDLITGTYVRNEGGEVIVGVKPPEKVVGYEYDTSTATLDWMHHQAGLRYPSLTKIEPLVPSRIITGLYDVTPDGLTVAGVDPKVKGLYLAAGFNGHGVMFSPAITRSVAELVVNGKAEIFDLAPLSLERFADANMSEVSTLHLL